MSGLQAWSSDDYSMTEATARRVAPRELRRPLAIDAEGARWIALRDALRRRIDDGALASSQVDRLWTLWARALTRSPHVRYPSVGISPEGVLQVSWAYADLPEHVATVEIQPDGSVEWFTRDAASGRLDGTELPEPTIASTVLDFVAEHFIRPRPSRSP